MCLAPITAKVVSLHKHSITPLLVWVLFHTKRKLMAFGRNVALLAVVVFGALVLVVGTVATWHCAVLLFGSSLAINTCSRDPELLVLSTSRIEMSPLVFRKEFKMPRFRFYLAERASYEVGHPVPDGYVRVEERDVIGTVLGRILLPKWMAFPKTLFGNPAWDLMGEFLCRILLIGAGFAIVNQSTARALKVGLRVRILAGVIWCMVIVMWTLLSLACMCIFEERQVVAVI
jgi:hypothetical protein